MADSKSRPRPQPPKPETEAPPSPDSTGTAIGARKRKADAAAPTTGNPYLDALNRRIRDGEPFHWYPEEDRRKLQDAKARGYTLEHVGGEIEIRDPVTGRLKDRVWEQMPEPEFSQFYSATFIYPDRKRGE